MCTMIAEKAKINASGKKDNLQIALDSCDVYYDHPDHVDGEHAIILSFNNEKNPISSRITLELTADSAIKIMEKINVALKRGNFS
ncbi:MAG: DUF6295 family protein [Dehalococcoidia bacterium]